MGRWHGLPEDSPFPTFHQESGRCRHVGLLCLQLHQDFGQHQAENFETHDAIRYIRRFRKGLHVRMQNNAGITRENLKKWDYLTSMWTSELKNWSAKTTTSLSTMMSSDSFGGLRISEKLFKECTGKPTIMTPQISRTRSSSSKTFWGDTLTQARSTHWSEKMDESFLTNPVCRAKYYPLGKCFPQFL